MGGGLEGSGGGGSGGGGGPNAGVRGALLEKEGNPGALVLRGTAFLARLLASLDGSRSLDEARAALEGTAAERDEKGPEGDA